MLVISPLVAIALLARPPMVPLEAPRVHLVVQHTTLTMLAWVRACLAPVENTFQGLPLPVPA